ncbi:hypothetical protein [Actinomadura atramentaria]|uniref:hypothetical protein n=1 Tax=Actinomadura atramentaria TaxID=1990 RepID=UPI00035D7815|nr:hypothetical protein [Actinomadura atramentaria]
MSRAEIPAPHLERPPDEPEPRRGMRGALVAAAAVGCAAVLALSAARLTAELTRDPTPAELAAARTAEVANRYRTWPAGRIFPASLRYTLQGSAGTARRLGVDTGTACPSGVDTALADTLASLGCRAVLRATYLDGQRALAITVGVVVLPDAGSAARAAKSFKVKRGVRALAFPGSYAARFDDAARQTAAVRTGGPYVVAATLGYADGRRRGRNPQPDLPPLAAQLAAGVLAPLAAPAAVDCAAREWSC